MQEACFSCATLPLRCATSDQCRPTVVPELTSRVRQSSAAFRHDFYPSLHQAIFRQLQLWQRTESVGADGPMRALRILVAEDDTVVGMLLGELLKEMGHEVCAIETTEAGAVAAALRCRPDLMIIDLRLGDGSGVSAVKEILRIGPISYLFVSGDMSSVRMLTPDTVIIQKPYREPDLADAIQRAIGAGL